MPADDPAADPVQDSGLRIAPFRAVRYVPGRISDLAAVTSPPYDVIDPDDATHLEALDPHNVVRLILPRGSRNATAGAGSDRYSQAGALLSRWRGEGVLARDPEPALYVYEQSGPGVRQLGVLAAVALRDPAERVVLPHEDVMPGPVADRLDLMRATAANLEPILLTHGGGADASAVIRAATQGRPTLETTTEDGLTQRVWAMTDPVSIARTATDLTTRQALIADGHHRWATYRALQAERRAAGHGAGPWDFGLAMLVDAETSPLRVAAIHRVVSGLGLEDALAVAGTVFGTQRLGTDLDAALGTLAKSPAAHPFVITDGTDYHLAAAPDPATVLAAMPPGHSARWHALDASVLHCLLLERLWQVPDTAGRVSYLHDPGAAVRAARRVDGVAVLMRPVAVPDVLALAAQGEQMPRKSTSFGPKPRTGLVLRVFDG